MKYKLIKILFSFWSSEEFLWFLYDSLIPKLAFRVTDEQMTCFKNTFPNWRAHEFFLLIHFRVNVVVSIKARLYDSASPSKRSCF